MAIFSGVVLPALPIPRGLLLDHFHESVKTAQTVVDFNTFCAIELTATEEIHGGDVHIRCLLWCGTEDVCIVKLLLRCGRGRRVIGALLALRPEKGKRQPASEDDAKQKNQYKPSAARGYSVRCRGGCVLLPTALSFT